MIILSVGFQTSVQDCGRFGFRKFGVPASGALDPAALRLCQLLVGNNESAAGIEVGGGRFSFRVKDERLFAWYGGSYRVRVGNDKIPARHCVRLHPDETVELRAESPSRTWFALSGGIDAPRILGSRSTDVRGVAQRVLRDGDELPLGAETAATDKIRGSFSQRCSDWSGPIFPVRKDRLRVIPGKNWTEKNGEELQRAIFQVSLQSDRMGLRLESGKIWMTTGDQISEAVTPGTIQVPPSGAPIVLLADCQTIGGYPKIAHVITVDLADAAQLQPHDSVRFVQVPMEDARRWLRQRERDIALCAAGLRARFG